MPKGKFKKNQWISFEECKPREGSLIFYANWRGCAYARHWEDENPLPKIEYKDATHWCYAELPDRPSNIENLWTNLPKQ